MKLKKCSDRSRRIFINKGLQMKLPPSGIHLFPFMKPFILSKLCIKSSLLQPSHFHSESGPKFLQSGLCFLLSGFFADIFAFFKYISEKILVNSIGTE